MSSQYFWVQIRQEFFFTKCTDRPQVWTIRTAHHTVLYTNPFMLQITLKSSLGPLIMKCGGKLQIYLIAVVYMWTIRTVKIHAVRYVHMQPFNCKHTWSEHFRYDLTYTSSYHHIYSILGSKYRNIALLAYL